MKLASLRHLKSSGNGWRSPKRLKYNILIPFFLNAKQCLPRPFLSPRLITAQSFLREHIGGTYSFHCPSCVTSKRSRSALRPAKMEISGLISPNIEGICGIRGALTWHLLPALLIAHQEPSPIAILVTCASLLGIMDFLAALTIILKTLIVSFQRHVLPASVVSEAFLALILSWFFN